jgi:lipopolysaccharide assembly outer membrane protein LptD (OstA)
MLLIPVAFFSIEAQAQTDTSSLTINNSLDSNNADLTKIRIEKADKLIGIKIGEGYNNKFIGNVLGRSGDMTITCDSAYLNDRDNRLKAFGNVHIMRGGESSAKADFVEYNGNTAQAIMKNNVQVFDSGNNLITDDLTYNLRSKIGIYKRGGRLVTDGTTISSDYGKYNGRSKQSYFKGNVFITNADSDIESKELTYNTETKKIVFLDESTVYGKEAMIETKAGTYNQKTGKANFTRRTTIDNENQIITANRLTYNEKTGSGTAKGNVIIFDKEENTTLYATVANYNKETGSGNAKGRVIIIDETENTILYADATRYNKETGYGIATGHVRYIDSNENIELNAGQAEYNEHNDFLVATKHPVLTTINDGDTILIVSDTMISLRNVDTMNLNNRIIKNGKSTYTLLHKKHLESYEDKKIIICNKRVQIYSDSMQAVCDSMLYLQADSMFHLFKKPVVWSSNQQAEGDTISIYMANNKVRKTELRSNSFIVNDTGYPKMYNQIKGKDIDAYFKDNEIENALVMGNAESIYYAENEEKKFIGLNRAEGAKIKILFENKEIQRIVFYNKPKGVFYPMEKIKEKDKFLDSFSWKSELRPKSRRALRKRP